MAGRQFDVTILAEDVRLALVLAAASRVDGSLTTARLLVEIMRVDSNTSGWARICLQSRSLDEIDPAQWPDLCNESAATWEDVPLSEDLAAALRVAARLVDEYALVPMPTVALVLGLIADPAAGAARALVEGTGCTHAELIDLVQDSLVGGRFESLDLRRFRDREPDLRVARQARPPLARRVVSALLQSIRSLRGGWDWKRVKAQVHRHQDGPQVQDGHQTPRRATDLLAGHRATRSRTHPTGRPLRRHPAQTPTHSRPDRPVTDHGQHQPQRTAPPAAGRALRALRHARGSASSPPAQTRRSRPPRSA